MSKIIHLISTNELSISKWCTFCVCKSQKITMLSLKLRSLFWHFFYFPAHPTLFWQPRVNYGQECDQFHDANPYQHAFTLMCTTVPTFNSCTKCVGSPGIKYDRMPCCLAQFHRHGCIDDLTNERSFYSQSDLVIDVLGLFLTWYSWVFKQPYTGRRPVDWCRN